MFSEQIFGWLRDSKLYIIRLGPISSFIQIIVQLTRILSNCFLGFLNHVDHSMTSNTILLSSIWWKPSKMSFHDIIFVFWKLSCLIDLKTSLNFLPVPNNKFHDLFNATDMWKLSYLWKDIKISKNCFFTSASFVQIEVKSIVMTFKMSA